MCVSLSYPQEYLWQLTVETPPFPVAWSYLKSPDLSTDPQLQHRSSCRYGKDDWHLFVISETKNLQVHVVLVYIIKLQEIKGGGKKGYCPDIHQSQPYMTLYWCSIVAWNTSVYHVHGYWWLVRSTQWDLEENDICHCLTLLNLWPCWVIPDMYDNFVLVDVVADSPFVYAWEKVYYHAQPV